MTTVAVETKLVSCTCFQRYSCACKFLHIRTILGRNHLTGKLVHIGAVMTVRRDELGRAEMARAGNFRRGAHVNDDRVGAGQGLLHLGGCRKAQFGRASVIIVGESDHGCCLIDVDRDD